MKHIERARGTLWRCDHTEAYAEVVRSAHFRFFDGSSFRDDAKDGRALENAIGSALLLVGLAERAGDRVSTFSGGRKRRLNLAAGLLHDPEILLLDEPTVGVDPQSRNAIFENLEFLKGRGKALLYTTHYMEEVERMADRIVVMDHGRVLADDTLAGLRERAGRDAGPGASLESLFLAMTGRTLRD